MLPISLIAEENLTVHYLLKTYAQRCGFQTVNASVGERVLEMVREYNPALILLNIDLPGEMRGWDVLAYLKNDEETRHIPVVIYTLNEENPDPQQTQEADACFQIPVLYEGFVDTLTEAGVCIDGSMSIHPRNSERRSSKRKEE